MAEVLQDGKLEIHSPDSGHPQTNQASSFLIRLQLSDFSRFMLLVLGGACVNVRIHFRFSLDHIFTLPRTQVA